MFAVNSMLEILKKRFLEWDNYFYANYDLSEYSDKEEKVKLMTEINLRKVSLCQLRVLVV